jgi:hypothetical protein
MVVEGKLSGLVTLSTKGGEKKQFANLDSTPLFPLRTFKYLCHISLG